MEFATLRAGVSDGSDFVQQLILNTKNAARYVGMSTSYLNRARIHGGGPRYLKIGRSVRYRVADLDLWLGERVQRHTGEAGR